ncbi:MAG: protein BatD [Bacteroidaceae bacterium]|nr:protein BatD [Bacteroidaceae bacterium]
MRKLLLTFTLLAVAFAYAKADEVTFTADAPSAVVMGQTFRLAYTVNTHDAKGFRVGNITDFDILSGPNQSSSLSTSIINGQRTSSKSLTFTCILRPKKEGTYTIPAATIVAGGKQMSSKELTVKVLPPDQKAQAQQSGSQGRTTTSSQTSGQISNDDLFIVATVNKKKVYEQEAILLTYKIYTTVNLTNMTGKMPDLKGFHTQEVEMPKGGREFELEHYKGRNYRTMVYSQYVLFPQQSGQLEIPSITFEGTVAQQVRNYDPFEAFFNGGSSYVNVQKPIQTPKLTIDVSPLPSGKPASFGGAVGDFSISSSISTTELKENEAVTLKVIISGTGNMKLIKTPEVSFPADFEVYDPKVDNKFTLKAGGLSGNKVIEYLAIPRHNGNYTIPGVEFTYFDIKSGAYKTLKTPEYALNVAKGEGSGAAVNTGYVSKEELRLLGQDIRYIDLKDAKLSPKGVYLYGTMGYWLWYIVPLVGFVVILIVYRKQAAENANIAKTKNKKAGKVATRRLKVAKQKMAAKDKAGFYDEVLKAVWGYLSDKLIMPVSELSKENIAAELAARQVSEASIKECTALLGDCEFARYAPTLSGISVEKIYDRTAELMNKLENEIKNSKIAK